MRPSGLDRSDDDARTTSWPSPGPGRDTIAASRAGPPDGRRARSGREGRQMAGLDDISVREEADERARGRRRRDRRDRALGGRTLQVRVLERHRHRVCAEGPERGHRPADLRQERRAGVAARVAPAGLSALGAARARADLGDARPARDRLPGPVLLCPAEEHGGAAEVAGGGRPGPPRHLRETRHPAEGADDPCRGRGRRRRTRRRPQGRGGRGLRQRFGGHDLQGGAGQGRGDLLLDLRGDARASRSSSEISRHRRALQRQLLCDAELGGLLRRLVRLRAARRTLPDGALDLLPHQCREHRPVRANADHRRQGEPTSPTSRAAPRRSATRRSFMRRSSRSSCWRTPR